MIVDARTPLPPGCVIAPDSVIECDELLHVDAFTIGSGVRIDAQRVELGYRSRIERDVSVRALRGRMEAFTLGDHALLSYDNQVLVPHFSAGDYTQIFNSCLISGYKPISIGHNCWVGQGAILNSAETLTIGNNVRMGGGQIWTHVASGELLEGSRFYGEKPVVIEDNVWLMGFGHMVAPGVRLARNSVIMAGSVVTKSTEPFHTYSGTPARDITDKAPAWEPMTLEAKMQRLGTFLQEFIEQNPDCKDRLHLVDAEAPRCQEELAALAREIPELPRLVFVRAVDLEELAVSSLMTVFDVATKQYLKRRTDLEERWFRFANGYRARFVPLPGAPGSSGRAD